jgi:hypothetical protein
VHLKLLIFFATADEKLVAPRLYGILPIAFPNLQPQKIVRFLPHQICAARSAVTRSYTPTLDSALPHPRTWLDVLFILMHQDRSAPVSSPRTRFYWHLTNN